MQMFEATPKQWGNSIGITIPCEVAREEEISLKKKVKVMVIGKRNETLKEVFGSLKLKKPTQKVMNEIDRGYD